MAGAVADRKTSVQQPYALSETGLQQIKLTELVGFSSSQGGYFMPLAMTKNGLALVKRKSRKGKDWERVEKARAEHAAIEQIRRVLQALDKEVNRSGSFSR